MHGPRDTALASFSYEDVARQRTLALVALGFTCDDPEWAKHSFPTFPCMSTAHRKGGTHEEGSHRNGHRGGERDRRCSGNGCADERNGAVDHGSV